MFTHSKWPNVAVLPFNERINILIYGCPVIRKFIYLTLSCFSYGINRVVELISTILVTNHGVFELSKNIVLLL